MLRSRKAVPLFLGAAAVLLMPMTARAADPTTADCLSANSSAVQLRNDNKLRAARGELLVCAAASCPADVRKECLRRVDEVNAQVPTIIFEVKEAASGKDLSAVKVTMDGQPLADRLEGTALSVDPGEHTFTFETAGQPAVQKQFLIREAQKDRRESVTFGEAAPLIQQPPPPPLLEPVAPSSGLGAQKVVAIVAAGVGVVGVAVGSIFGAMAFSKKNDAQSVCPGDCPDQSGINKWNDAKSTAQISDVAFVIGGVGLVGGAVLWFTAKSPSSEGLSAQVRFGPGSVQVNGAW
jgi:hypothetical protein